MMELNFTGGNVLSGWLVLSLALFSIGLFGLLTRRSAVGVLISVELMLNAGALNFVIFDRVAGQRVDGQVFAIFVIGLAAAEVLTLMAILMALVRRSNSIDLNTMTGKKMPESELTHV